MIRRRNTFRLSLMEVIPQNNGPRGVVMPSLEYRKVYPVGSSLVITLPRGWLAFFGIKAGDQVKIVTDQDLVISPPQGEESASQCPRCQLPVSDVAVVRARHGKS